MFKLLKIDAEGKINGLYDDSLHNLGTVKNVARASTIEPNPDGGWDVRLTDEPRNGQFKGRFIGNFSTRKKAIEAEVVFVTVNILEGQNRG
jgi:hypothetical protein